MFKKMMRHLTNNPGLKIASVVIAAFVWLIVVNLDDPKTTRTFIVTVTEKNGEMLEQAGKAYTIENEDRIAKIDVTGKRSIMDGLSASDFLATADLSQMLGGLDELGEKWVPITVDPPKRYADDLEIMQRTNNIKIMLEDSATEQFYISGNAVGTPMEGYAIGDITTSPNLIKISGPQSVVSRIDKVSVSVNVERLSQDTTINVTPVLYDKSGDVIETTKLKLSQEQVTVSVQLLGKKTVPVRCDTTGTPENGYVFTGLEYAPETIEIKGDPAVLNNITAINIPGEAINLEGAVEDVENSIDITTYLEELGVSLVNPEENKIAVKALIERLEVKNYELPVDAIEVLNLPEKYEVIYHDTGVMIPLRGRNAEISELTVGQIKASMNLNALQPGAHTVSLKITVDEKFEVMGQVTLEITIGEKTDEPPAGGTGSGTENEPGT